MALSSFSLMTDVKIPVAVDTATYLNYCFAKELCLRSAFVKYTEASLKPQRFVACLADLAFDK